MNGIRQNKPKKEGKSLIFTKETLGVVLILFATLMLICLITRGAIFSTPGEYVNSFLFGIMGYFAYPVVIGLIVLGVCMVSGKKIRLHGKRKLLFIVSVILLDLIIHTITMHGDAGLSYGEYLSKAYVMGAGGIATCSGGGIITAIVACLFAKLLTSIGCYVVFAILLGLSVYFIVRDFKVNGIRGKVQKQTFRSTYVKEPEVDGLENDLPTMDYPVGDIGDAPVSVKPEVKQKLFVNNSSDFEFKTKRDVKKEENSVGMKIEFSSGGLGVVTSGATYSKSYDNDIKQKIDYVKTPAEINIESALNGSKYGTPYTAPSTSTYNVPTTSVSEPISTAYEEKEEIVEDTAEKEIPMYYEETPSVSVPTYDDSAEGRAKSFVDNVLDVPEYDEEVSTPVTPEAVKGDEFGAEVFDYTYAEPKAEEPSRIQEIKEEKDEDPFDAFLSNRRSRSTPIAPSEPVIERVEETPIIPEIDVVEEQEETIVPKERVRGLIFDDDKEEKPAFTSRVSADNNLTSSRRMGFDIEKKVEEPKVEEKPAKEIPPINREYFRPPLDLLETYTTPADMPSENHEERKEIIQRTLEEFHINAVPQNHVQGPAITRYEILMPSGIPVKRVLNYANDLKMRLASKDEVRIEAPIPGKNLVGVEVANKSKITVGLKEVLEGMAGQTIKPNALQFVLGKDLVGNSISDNLAKGPHYLVAGATGSGKSVCLNVMLVSLIMRYSPEELRIILVDPKQVEFRPYEHLPHLMIDEIITDPKKTLAMLSWAQQEMERRYSVFRNCEEMIVDIDAYNSTIASATVPKMPRIVIVIDELADLMESCKKDLEARIQAIAQKARSAGIHLVLATQRPSVNIITGTIKANLPSRIAFKVMNFTDSQTILGEQGAEKLLGNGDMLYKNSSMPSVERYQGAYISSREVNNIASYIKEKNKAYFDDELTEFLEKATSNAPEQTGAVGGGDEGGDENDDFFLKVLAYAVNSGTVSISQLQRRFQIGWSRAGGLVDKMERMQFITGNLGTKGRKVLLTREGFEQRFGPMPDDTY